MAAILADILSLIQYQQLTKADTLTYRLEYCLYCGKGKPHRHGSYSRKADRTGNSHSSLNPVYIQRYFCPSCEKTCSACTLLILVGHQVEMFLRSITQGSKLPPHIIGLGTSYSFC